MTLEEILKEANKVTDLVQKIEMLKRGRSVYLVQKKSVNELVEDLADISVSLAGKCRQYGK